MSVECDASPFKKAPCDTQNWAEAWPKPLYGSFSVLTILALVGIMICFMLVDLFMYVECVAHTRSKWHQKTPFERPDALKKGCHLNGLWSARTLRHAECILRYTPPFLDCSLLDATNRRKA